MTLAQRPATGGPAAPAAGTVADGAALLVQLASRRRGRAPRGTRRMQALCTAMGSPQLAVPAVHVVGTDGKTSVVRMMAALLRSLGVRAGTTTSPHLGSVEERIDIDGAPVDPDRLATACTALRSALPEAEARAGEPVTFFEAVTATALWAFADAKVDVALVEAGIGGAGDATNVVQGRVVVITPVGHDHPEVGATLVEKAHDKAGVIEPGGLVLCAAQQPEVAAVVARIAAERGATLLRAGHDFGVLTRRPSPDGQLVGIRGLEGTPLRVTLPVRGAHQAANAALALAAAQALLGTPDLDRQRIRQGFAEVRLPGRVQWLERAGACEVVLDGAHDVPAATALVAALRERPVSGPTVVVLGVGGDRDPQPIVAVLAEVADAFVVTAASSPGATPPERLATALEASGVSVEVVPEVASALATAAARCGHQGRVVVTGSLHLAGEASLTMGARP